MGTEILEIICERFLSPKSKLRNEISKDLRRILIELETALEMFFDDFCLQGAPTVGQKEKNCLGDILRGRSSTIDVSFCRAQVVESKAVL